MNTLFVGSQRKIDPPKRGTYLFIADDVPNVPSAQVFDPITHSLDPLNKISERQARDLAHAIYSAYPEGTSTLTVRNGRINLAPALLEADRFDLIKTEDEEIQRIKDDLLFLPVLKHALCGTKHVFALKRHTVVLARLNRKEIGEFPALILGLVLMTMFKGQIIVPDLGFFGRDIHTSLVRENRLIGGCDYLDQLPLHLRRSLLLLTDKDGAGSLYRRVLYDDAVTLAKFAGLRPDNLRETNDYNTFIDQAMLDQR